MSAETSSAAETIYVGIDVAQEALDVALRPAGERWRVRHDEQGLAQLVAALAALAPARVVLEATGGLEAALAHAARPAARAGHARPPPDRRPGRRGAL